MWGKNSTKVKAKGWLKDNMLINNYKLANTKKTMFCQKII